LLAAAPLGFDLAMMILPFDLWVGEARRGRRGGGEGGDETGECFVWLVAVEDDPADRLGAKSGDLQSVAVVMVVMVVLLLLLLLLLPSLFLPG